MPNYQIPLSNAPQQFEITLGGVDYQLTCKWNDSPEAGWTLDIADSTGAPIVANVPLITGEDCLAGLEYLGIPGSLWVMTDGDPFAVPTLDNLGKSSNLYFQTEVDNAGT